MSAQPRQKSPQARQLPAQPRQSPQARQLTEAGLEAKKAYFIHNNGSRPFAVVDKGGYVEVFKLNVSDDDFNPDNLKYVYHGKISYDKIMPGKDVRFEGNSILLKKGDSYIYIGEERIASFQEEDQKILDFLSPVGPNDSPYPYAVTKDYAYLINLSARLPYNDVVKDVIAKDKIGLGPYKAVYDRKVESTPMKITEIENIGSLLKV
jgi:hypothetical protein